MSLTRQQALPGGISRLLPRPHSVRAKLIRIVLSTTAIALIVAAIAMLTYDLTNYRQSVVSGLAAEAGILALSTAPALAFDDLNVAERNLTATQARATIRVAAVYGPGGKLYAFYTRPGERPPPQTLPVSRTGARLQGDQIEYVQPILQSGERLGSVYLRATYGFIGRVWAYLEIFVLVILLGMAVALVSSTALQKVITEPLDAMARVAHEVIDRRDYSLRAGAFGRDEIGMVVAAFNNMLDEVENREKALQSSNSALSAEIRVREAAEAALREADRRKDEFLATLAHELRNPLAPIRHAVKILEAPGATEQQRDWGRKVISRQVQHMALLLDDLLDVSRITRGRLELRKDYVDLQSLIAAAIEPARPLIEAKRHTLQVALPAEPIELEVDPLRMSQALTNLLTNAAKYTDAGGTIRVSAALEASGLVIRVADNGIGLSAAAIPNLFEMFSQVDSAIDRAEGGLGIGLSLVKGLLALHGGSVEASSAGIGLGSEFVIRLPRSALVGRTATMVSGTPAPPPSVGPQGRILVVDDNRDAAETLALVLKMSGHELLLAHSGREALELGSRERPDVIILDIGMPDMSGYEVARRIRREAWGRKMFLLAITGWGQEDDKDAARAAGFDGHLTKPVDPDEVETLLAGFLKMRPA
ncbi:MAG TPA: response regulator [Steroidobacteraceae bacterium]|nr:response regulator [Steroidobacteraceae bacterium]